MKKKFIPKNILVKELGVLGNGSPTYQKNNHSSKNVIIDKTAKDIKMKFDITITEDMKCLQTPYWLPKMYKDPIGARFIIASKKCTVKTISKNVTSDFKLLFRAIQKCHNKSKNFSGINYFWVVQNNVPVLDT